MKANVSKLLRSALSMVLAVCLVIGMCPAAFAAETDAPALTGELKTDLQNLVSYLETVGPDGVEAAITYIDENRDVIKAYAEELGALLTDEAEKLGEKVWADMEQAGTLTQLEGLGESLKDELLALKNALAAEVAKQQELLAAAAEETDETVKAEIQNAIDACNQTIANIENGIAAVEAALAPVDAAVVSVKETLVGIREAILYLDNAVAFELIPAVDALVNVAEGATDATLESTADAINSAKAAVEAALALVETAYDSVVEIADTAAELTAQIPNAVVEAADAALAILEPIAADAAAYIEERVQLGIAGIQQDYAEEIAALEAKLAELQNYDPVEIAGGIVGAAIYLYADDVEAIKADLEAKYEELKAAADEAIPGIQAEIDALEAKLAEAEDKLAVLKGEAEAAAEEIEAIAQAKIDEALAELEAQKPAIEAQIAAVKAEMDAKIAEVQAAVEAEMPAVIAAVEEAIETIKAIKADAETAAAELKAIVDAAVAEATAAIENLINQIVAAWEAAYAAATTTSYVVNADSYYTAIGDATAAGDSYVEDMYAELLKDKLPAGNYKNLASADVVFAKDLAAQIADPAIAAADLITVGLGNVTFLDYAVQNALTKVGATGEYEALDWSGIAGEYLDYEVIEPIFMEIYEGLWLYKGMDKQLAAVITGALEAYAYGAASYATQVPELINAIRTVNNDATVVLVGMYNPLDGVVIELGEQTLDIGEYIDILVQAASIHGKAYAMLTGNAIYVDAPEVDTVNQETVLTLNNLIKGDALLPNADGHKYIQTCIYNALGLHNPYAVRVYGSNRYETSLSIAKTMQGLAEGAKFENVVVANGGDFPDALAGTYLADVKNAPILLVNDGYAAKVADYIKANMAANGTIYILGGESSVSAETEKTLAAAGAVVRVAGKSRYVTNLEILTETGAGCGELLVVDGNGYADSLSASSSGCPVLLVNKTLREDQKAYLATTDFDKITIIGGTNSIPETMENELAAYSDNIGRVAGSNRYKTSVEVAKYFEGTGNDNVVLAWGENFPDGLCAGALASALGAPVVLTNDAEDVVDDYVKQVSLGVVTGGAGKDNSQVTDEEIVDIFELFSTADIAVNPYN